MAAVDINIRWMIRREMPTVLGIEKASFDNPWNEEEFLRCLRQRNCIGMVAETGDDVLGYMIYELFKTRIHLVSIAVDPPSRRLAIGTDLIQRLVEKLGPDRRSRITLEVREGNLPAQLFFKQLGFRAFSVVREFYEDTDEDAYLMQYRCLQKETTCH